MKTLILTSIILLAAANSQAKCEAGSETIFACTTTKGKKVEVCDAGKTISYSYGKAQPEIVVKVPRNQASTQQWPGVGRYTSYSVSIPNGDTVYTVFWGFDRLEDDHETSAGVNVKTKGKNVATVKCLDKGLVQSLEDIDLKPSN